MHRPYRLGFAEENDVSPQQPKFYFLQFSKTFSVDCPVKVTDIAAGYGFTVFITKGKKMTSSQVFGTGLNTDSQIGQ